MIASIYRSISIVAAMLLISNVFAHDIELRRETTISLSPCQTPDHSNDYPLAQAFVQNLAQKIMQANPDTFHSDLDPSNICISVAPVTSQRAWATTDQRSFSVDAGLLLRVQNNSQLALTIAHELAHLTLRHTPLEGNPLPAPAREQAGQLLIQKAAAVAELLGAGKGNPMLASYHEQLNSIQQVINDLFKRYFDDETIANWEETEADVTGAHFYLNAGYPSVELAWRHEQLVLGLQAAGLNPINQNSGPNFAPHGPPSTHTSEQRAAIALRACQLATPTPSAPLRGTQRYAMPCWQIWNLKINLPAQNSTYAQLYTAGATAVPEEISPTLEQVKEELCAKAATRLDVYCQGPINAPQPITRL